MILRLISIYCNRVSLVGKRVMWGFSVPSIAYPLALSFEFKMTLAKRVNRCDNVNVKVHDS